MVQLQRLVVAPSQIQADRISLNKDQLHYLTRVLRLKSGEAFIAMDGQGQTWRVELLGDLGQILESLEVRSELPIAVTLAIALPKNGFDDVIRQVTELGVAKIVPIISDRTLFKPNSNRLDRWQKIIQEASEQSERTIVPKILEPIYWQQHLKTPSLSQTRFLCWERGDSPSLLTGLNQAGLNQAGKTEIELAIGPEGGWTQTEVEAAICVGYQPVSLGQRILRAVTASVAAMAIAAAQIEK